MATWLNSINQKPKSVIERAVVKSEKVLKESGEKIQEFISKAGQSSDDICFAVVGSVGRHEALEASDLDLIPICRTNEALLDYKKIDADLREHLRASLNIKVSKGEDLTSAVHLDEIIRTDAIGGKSDSSTVLTKRVLILTESKQSAGGWNIDDVRYSILNAYTTQERTSGRHVLSLCNDIARYFKTLCVEYKARIDEENKDWCTRNLKLRHSRKIWYLSCMLSVALSAEKHPHGDKDFIEKLLMEFNKSPIERIIFSLHEKNCSPSIRIIEQYALFLDFMSRTETREALSKVNYEDRYNMDLNNPFPSMKFSSDLIHHEILNLIEKLGHHTKANIISWFLL